MLRDRVVEPVVLPDVLAGQHRRPEPVTSHRLKWMSPKEVHAVRDRWTLAAIKNCTNDAAALRIIPIIAMRIHASTGYAFPSNESLAADAACSVSAVKRGMAILTARGCVQVERDRGGKNGGDRRKVFPSMPVGGSTGEPPGEAGGSAGELVGGSTGEPAGGSHAVPINSERETLKGNPEGEPDAGAVEIDPIVRRQMDSNVERFAWHLWRVSAGEKTVQEPKIVDGAEAWVADLLGPYPEGRSLLYRRPDRSVLVRFAIEQHVDEACRIAAARLRAGECFRW